MEPYFDTGPYKREITTKSREAEVWFNRGLNWCYAFHHKEALRCFEKMINILSTVGVDPDHISCYNGSDFSKDFGVEFQMFYFSNIILLY